MVTANGDAAAGFTIAEVAARIGLTAHTLRYYERIGIVPRVARASSGHRRYSATDVQFLALLAHLHATGMPIRRLLAYARLVRRGDATIAARRALLDEHRCDVEAKLAHLQATHLLICKKLEIYDRKLAA